MPAALKDLPPLILASASPRRQQLLRQVGVAFTVLPSEAVEIHQTQLTARELAQVNAYRKARGPWPKSIRTRWFSALITLVYLDMELFGKPATLEAAYSMLEKLQGRTHEVVTGICLLQHYVITAKRFSRKVRLSLFDLSTRWRSAVTSAASIRSTRRGLMRFRRKAT